MAMQSISRRGFLSTTAAGVGAATLTSVGAAGAAETTGPKSGVDKVPLGKTGLNPSVLGIGTGMRGGSEMRALGTDGISDLIHYAVERGISYIDTADMYQTHVFLQLAMQGIARDKFFIQSKTMSRSAEVVKADVDRFLREMRCKYLDTCLMHCLTTADWPTTLAPVMDVLSKAKEQGKIKAHGVSCHNLDALKMAAETDWVDVVLVRINPQGVKMDGTPEEVAPVIQKLHDRGVGVLGMKIYGEGQFTTLEQRKESLKYVLGLKTVDAFTIGFNSKAQIDETLDSIKEVLA